MKSFDPDIINIDFETGMILNSKIVIDKNRAKEFDVDNVEQEMEIHKEFIKISLQNVPQLDSCVHLLDEIGLNIEL